MKRSISILGSTGSIGLTSLKIIDKKIKYFSIYLLSSNKNYKLIINQIKKYKPKYFIISNKLVFDRIKKKFSNHKTIILNNFEKIIPKCDVTISSIPGIAGLKPTYLMIEKSKKLLIANKETIICAWELIKKKSAIHKTKIVPIDSEHFSILKLLENQNTSNIEKIYLTASVGPFLNYTSKQLKNITVAKALNHPKWKMGKKISIDSATLMNKLFELIEAKKLFNIPLKKLEILIHPNSLVHAAVKFKNGLTHFIYHETTMIIPIANALFEQSIEIKDFYRKKGPKHSEYSIENLEFRSVDSKIFPIFKIKSKIDEYPSTPIILNSANETLIGLFLKKKIKFFDITKTILKIMKDRNYRKYAIRRPYKIEDILSIDSWARHTAIKILKKNG